MCERRMEVGVAVVLSRKKKKEEEKEEGGETMVDTLCTSNGRTCGGDGWGAGKWVSG